MTKKKKQKNTFDLLFSTNNEGVEVVMGYNPIKDEEVIFIIREAQCKHHVKAQRKYNKHLEMSRKNPKKNNEVLSKIIAEGIIVDWKGVFDENGEPMPCTFENKVNALKKEKLFFKVMEEASRSENFIDPELNLDEVTPEDDTEKN